MFKQISKQKEALLKKDIRYMKKFFSCFRYCFPY